MTIMSLHLLARCSQKVHPASFYAVAKLTMPKAVILIDWAISLGCLGTGIAYLMIIGSLLPQVMAQIGLTGIFLQKQFWVTIAFGICSPICYAHRINAFKWTSLIADISIVFVVLIILLYSIHLLGYHFLLRQRLCIRHSHWKHCEC
jgi:amino acid permease